MNYKGKKPEYWRTYLNNGINDNREEVTVKTSNFMIDNLIRYLKEGKTLSDEGYQSIMENWDTIKENTTHSYYHKYLANKLLRKERARIEDKLWDVPKYQEKVKGFFGRLNVRLRWKFA